jgi:hypothetical protein
MNDRERGFLVIQRQIQSSDVWLSISAEQRSVFMSMLLLANWTPGRFLYGSEWVEVGRGELAHSLETIAKHAKVSIKVVRSTLTKLIAGHVVGTRQGTTRGTGPRVLTFFNYNKHQGVDDAAGTGLGMDPGDERAQQGHSTGTAGAPIEPSKPLQPTTLSLREAGAAARQEIDNKPPLDGLFPATAAVLANLRAQGISIKHAQTPEDRSALEQAIAEATTTVATQRVAESFRQNKRASLGWHLEAITGPSVKNQTRRGMATPSTDFTSPEATTL